MDKKYLREPGEYTALIIGAEAKESSKGLPMLVVTFKDIINGGEINAYFVHKKDDDRYKHFDKARTELGVAAGVGPIFKKEQLIGCKVGIKVRKQKPKEGEVESKYSEIFGYFPYAFNESSSPASDSDLPF